MQIASWKTSQPEFRQQFNSFLQRLRAQGGGTSSEKQDRVEKILQSVENGGDEAVLEFTRRFDRCDLTANELRIGRERMKAALDELDTDLRDALQLAAERIETFQRKLLPDSSPSVQLGGRTMTARIRPVESAGIYVPGGGASLASSVLMNAIPADVAGVERIVMATPPAPDGSVTPDRLAAARLAGVDEIYRVGGAQAIAALAHGTDTIPAVDFIAGPGNIYVALAKKSLFGQVGIDLVGGPSEVTIIADHTAEAECVAADMIAQAEHDPGSAVLLSTEEGLTSEVREALDEQLDELSTGETARGWLQEFGALVTARDLDECIELTDELAPEHLEIMTEHPRDVAGNIHHAGAIFLGTSTPVAVGDYIAGPSHVLPTGGTARFSSGLNVNHFLRRTGVIEYSPSALADDAGALCRLAEVEGLHAHAQSVRRRTQTE
jgi:histidinol dehydrogenase